MKSPTHKLRPGPRENRQEVRLQPAGGVRRESGSVPREETAEPRLHRPTATRVDHGQFDTVHQGDRRSDWQGRSAVGPEKRTGLANIPGQCVAHAGHDGDVRGALSGFECNANQTGGGGRCVSHDRPGSGDRYDAVPGSGCEFGVVEHEFGENALLYAYDGWVERASGIVATAGAPEYDGRGCGGVGGDCLLPARECDEQCATGTDVDDVAVCGSWFV